MTHTLDKTPALKLFLQYLSNKLGKHQHFDHKNNAAVEFYYCDLWALPPLPSSSLFRETVGTWVHFMDHFKPFQTHEVFAYGRNCSFLTAYIIYFLYRLSDLCKATTNCCLCGQGLWFLPNGN